MSIETCAKCGTPIDTDKDVECYSAHCGPLCPACREDDEEQDYPRIH